jgi:osmotically-inducible protein OsmY
MKNVHPFANFFAVMVLVVSIAACSMISGRESPGQYTDDTTITTKVKADILGDPDLKVLQINVETMQGVVQLSGFVDSQQSKIKAEELARKVGGVKAVRDNLVIR